MRVYNVMEDFVFDLLPPTLAKIKDFCGCDQCRKDVAAIVLNDIKPKYVVRDEGYVYCKADVIFQKYDMQITASIAKAAMMVMKNPRHF